MGAALEIFVVPVILITALVLALLRSSFSGATVFASAVGLGLLYFVVVKVLRQLGRSDEASEAADRTEIRDRERDAREAR